MRVSYAFIIHKKQRRNLPHKAIFAGHKSCAGLDKEGNQMV